MKEKEYFIGLEQMVKENNGKIQVIFFYKQEFINFICLATRGVKVTPSSIEKGQPIDLIRKLDCTELWTKDVPSSWFCIGKKTLILSNVND